MENKNITFCSCKPSKKSNIEPHESFTSSYEKSVELLDELQNTISKGRKANKL